MDVDYTMRWTLCGKWRYPWSQMQTPEEIFLFIWINQLIIFQLPFIMDLIWIYLPIKRIYSWKSKCWTTSYKQSVQSKLKLHFIGHFTALKLICQESQVLMLWKNKLLSVEVSIKQTQKMDVKEKLTYKINIMVKDSKGLFFLLILH